VGEYAETWLRERAALRLRPRTAERYRGDFSHHIVPALGALELGALTKKHIRDFLTAKAAAGLSRGSLSNLLVPLRAMLNTAVEDELLSGNPAARLGRALPKKPARIVRALTADELARVLALARRLYPKHADLLHILAWTGLRLGEAVALQWGDLDLSGRFLEVNRSAQYRAHRLHIGTPKSGQERRVDVPTVLVDRLRERRSLREAEAALAGRELSSWVFPAPSDEAKPMNPVFLRYKVWYRLLAEAGLRAVRLHDLRHTYAVLLLQAGEPVPYVSQQLGHSSIQVTVDIYGRFIPGANRAAVDRLAAATGEGVPGLTALRENYDFPGSPEQAEATKSATH
jgi:integrase